MVFEPDSSGLRLHIRGTGKKEVQHGREWNGDGVSLLRWERLKACRYFGKLPIIRHLCETALILSC
jgi:hypothetical protein